MVTEVRHDPEAGRYELIVDGDRVGVADYEVGDGYAVFPHTYVDPAFRGRGLAERLVREALDDVRTRGLRVVPTCWYVAGFVERNADYADLL